LHEAAPPVLQSLPPHFDGGRKLLDHTRTNDCFIARCFWKLIIAKDIDFAPMIMDNKNRTWPFKINIFTCGNVYT
jgi:predicted nuclease of predicted toxin-antitoxin system